MEKDEKRREREGERVLVWQQRTLQGKALAKRAERGEGDGMHQRRGGLLAAAFQDGFGGCKWMVSRSTNKQFRLNEKKKKGIKNDWILLLGLLIHSDKLHKTW